MLIHLPVLLLKFSRAVYSQLQRMFLGLCIWLIIGLSLFPIKVYSDQSLSNEADRILAEIKFCQIDTDTGKPIFGYNNFAKCNSKCIRDKETRNWNNWEYVNCAWDCRNKTARKQYDKQFLAEAYEQCVNRILDNRGVTKSTAKNLCNNNSQFLFGLPLYCYDYVEEPATNNSFGQQLLLNLFPACFSINVSSENLLVCVRSIATTLLVVGIVFLFVILGYLAAQLFFNNSGNFWVLIKEKMRDLIIGILLIGFPVAIVTAIDPNLGFLNFGDIAKLNLDLKLKDSTSGVVETCPGDPDESGVVKSYAFEANKECGEWGEPCDYNIKFPTLALYNCRVFFGFSRDGGHATGYFPFFNIDLLEVDLDKVSRGSNYIDYAGPKVTAGKDGVGMINVDKINNQWIISTRFWDGQKYDNTEKQIYSSPNFLYVAKIAYHKGNWIAIAVINEEYKVANLGPDLTNPNTSAEWRTFESEKITYKGHAELITNKNFSELYAVFGPNMYSPARFGRIMKYDITTNTFTQYPDNNTTLGPSCFRPTGDLDSKGYLHLTCDDGSGKLYYYTNKSGALTSTILTDNGVSGVLRIDNRDGIHIGYITANRPRKPAYIYSSDGERWNEPIIAEKLFDREYDYVANMSGVALSSKKPYLWVAFEDFTFGKAKDNGSRRTVFVLFGAKVEEED